MNNEKRLLRDGDSYIDLSFFGDMPHPYLVKPFDTVKKIYFADMYARNSFVNDIDPWEEYFDDVNFDGYDESHINSFKETYEYMVETSNAYLKIHPEAATEVKEALEKFKKRFADKMQSKKGTIYRFSENREEREGLYKYAPITHDAICVEFYIFKELDEEKVFLEFLDTMEKYKDKYLPRNYSIGKYTGVYDPEKRQEIIEAWVNRTKCIDNDILSFTSADERNIEIKSINRSDYSNGHCNLFKMKISIKYLNQQDNMEKFTQLCDELAVMLDVVCGKITNDSIPYNPAEIPKDLRIRYPDLSWKEYFGSPYIDMWEYEKLRTVPCYKVENLNEYLVSVQLTESIYDPIPVELKDKIRNHLGKDSFVEDYKIATNYPYGKAPCFKIYKLGRDR